MTRELAVVELRRLVSGLPDGDVESRVARAVERLAVSDLSEEVRAVLIEVGLGLFVVGMEPEVEVLRELLEREAGAGGRG